MILSKGRMFNKALAPLALAAALVAVTTGAVVANVACYGRGSQTYAWGGVHLPGGHCWVLCGTWYPCNSNRTWAGSGTTRQVMLLCQEKRTLVSDANGNLSCTGALLASGWISVEVFECEQGENPCPPAGGSGGTGEDDPNPCGGC